ncbi:MAG: hypothetical protein ACSHXL_01460 [Bacteroidota bacterium]
MITLLSKIFGSGDVIAKGLDLIDSMHTSDEEQIKANAQAKVDLLRSYAPFKLAQRYLAVMFTVTFLLSFVLVLGMTLSGKGNTEDVKIILSEFYIGEIMISIVLFYFGGGAFEGIIEKRGKK